MENIYPHLNAKFLEAMNEIGLYGLEKYGEESFDYRTRRGDKSRGNLATSRTSQTSLRNHAAIHFRDYCADLNHDYFGTKRHQLAAVAFNAMMEFYFAGLEDEALPPNSSL